MTGIIPKVFTGAPPNGTFKSESEPAAQKFLVPDVGGETLAVDEVAASVALSANANTGFFAVIAGPKGNGKTIEITQTGAQLTPILVSDNGTAVVINIRSSTPDAAVINALVGLKTLKMRGSGVLTVIEGPLTLIGGTQKRSALIESAAEAHPLHFPTDTAGVGPPKRDFDPFMPGTI